MDKCVAARSLLGASSSSFLVVWYFLFSTFSMPTFRRRTVDPIEFVFVILVDDVDNRVVVLCCDPCSVVPVVAVPRFDSVGEGAEKADATIGGVSLDGALLLSFMHSSIGELCLLLLLLLDVVGVAVVLLKKNSFPWIRDPPFGALQMIE